MWPPLLSAVADRLGIDRCFVLGVSGGAPYALVSAWAMPERVCGAAVVCGAPPLADVEPQNIFAVYRLLLRLYRWRRGAVRLALRQAKPFMSLRLPGWARRGLLQVLTPPDAEVLRDPRTFDLCFENFREAWLGEADGVFHDAEIYAQPWAFPLGEIRVPVAIWHGKQDRNFSWRLAEEVTAAIPSAVGHFVENEGHFSLPIRRSSEILRDLMESDSLPFQSAGRMTSLS